MTINADTLAQIVDEREELQARSETLYDALTACYAIAKKGEDDAPKRIVELVKRTKDELDDLLNAAQKRGMHYELLDEEAMEWYDIAERQFHLLTAEGKRRFVAARKRAARDERRDEARAGAGTPEGTAPVVRSLILMPDDDMKGFSHAHTESPIYP